MQEASQGENPDPCMRRGRRSDGEQRDDRTLDKVALASPKGNDEDEDEVSSWQHNAPENSI